MNVEQTWWGMPLWPFKVNSSPQDKIHQESSSIAWSDTQTEQFFPWNSWKKWGVCETCVKRHESNMQHVRWSRKKIACGYRIKRWRIQVSAKQICQWFSLNLAHFHPIWRSPLASIINRFFNALICSTSNLRGLGRYGSSTLASLMAKPLLTALNKLRQAATDRAAAKSAFDAINFHRVSWYLPSWTTSWPNVMKTKWPISPTNDLSKRKSIWNLGWVLVAVYF